MQKMKQFTFRILISAVFLLFSGVAGGQALRKGSVIEFSEISVTLQPGASLESFCDILCYQLAPAIARAFPGTEVYFAKGDRGNAENKVGAIWVFESEAARNRYFENGGKLTPEGQQAYDQLAEVTREIEKLGDASRVSEEWIVLNHSRPEALKNYYEYLLDFCNKDNIGEVPVAPATVGVSDPLLQRLTGELARHTSELIRSGATGGDPQYQQYTREIENVKQTLREAVTRLSGTPSPAFVSGGSFGLHELSVNLKPGVTMEQFQEFLLTRYIPTVSSHFSGLQLIALKPRGTEGENRLAWVNYFQTEGARDDFWPEPDTPSERAEEALARVQPVLFELLELGDWSDDYGVWIIH